MNAGLPFLLPNTQGQLFDIFFDFFSVVEIFPNPMLAYFKSWISCEPLCVHGFLDFFLAPIKFYSDFAIFKMCSVTCVGKQNRI